MKKDRLKLISKDRLSPGGPVWRLRFEAPEIDARPGQFVNIEVAGKYLRRPISVSEYTDGILTLIVQTVGEGTRQIVESSEGSCFDMLTGLGNTFSLVAGLNCKDVLLIGGGVGYAPLVGLLKKLTRKSNVRPLAVFGFNGALETPIIHLEELKEEFGEAVEYCTMTGELGRKGNALEVAIRIAGERNMKPEYFYTCGPLPMMKAVGSAFGFDGEMSLEARMGCGFGACMGCSIKTVDGPRRICKEGPVFKKSKLL